jgi:PAS domain S-box-containing protein
MTSSRDTPVPDTLLSLLDESDDAIFTLDHEGRFSYVNPATAAIVGSRPPT